jgi:hypothetical protein
MQLPKMETSRKLWLSRQGVTRKAEAPTRATTAYTPAPGHRYAFMYAYGPEISLYGYATLSFEASPGKFLATGHSIDGTGPRKFPVFAAYTDGRLQDGTVLAHAVGDKPWGTLIYDGQFGSVIEKQTNVPTVPVRVTIKVDGTTVGDKIQHNIALDKNIFVEDLALAYSFFIPIYNRLDYRGKLYLGTAKVNLKWEDGSTFNDTFEVGREEYDDDFNIIYTPGTTDDIVSVIYYAYPIKGKAITSATLTLDVVSSE